MPAPGAPGLPLLGQGENKSPAYNTLGISGGGTGTNSITTNRLLYAHTDDNDNNIFTAGNHYINNTKIAINSTDEPTENLYVNGNSKFNGNILPNLTTHTIGSSTARWNTLYVNTLMARNGNSVISEQDYETDCNTDCMIRIDSHINKGKDYNLNFSALPPYGNNANTLITVNRHSSKYITQLGLTSKGIFYRLGEAAVPTKDKEWNQLIYREVNSGGGSFSDIGSTTTPIYLASTGKIVSCSTYAGGTAVTLNGTSAASKTASFYAPTSAGTSGYILKSNGTGAPSWIQTLPITNGGTGTTSIAGNRLMYVYNSAITTSSHYVNGTKLAINSTTEPNQNLYVNGVSKLSTLNITSDSIYSDATESYSLGTEDSFFTSAYIRALNIGTDDNYTPLLSEENGISASVYLPISDQDSKLVYIDKDIATGSSTQFIYIDDTGKATASNGTIGNSGLQLIYLSNGVLTESTASLANDGMSLMYLNSGELTKSTSNVGSVTNPVYLNNGTVTQCTNPGAYNSTTKKYEISKDANGQKLGGIPFVDSEGIMEIGQYLNLHADGSPKEDFDTRIQAQSGSGNTIILPSVSGLLVTKLNNNTAIGNGNSPVYVKSNGEIAACNALFTSFSTSSTNPTGTGETISITVGGVSKSITLRAASSSDSGVITTGSQTIAGPKTFTGTTTFTGQVNLNEKIVLDSSSYGDETPSTGDIGQIFFKLI